MNLSRNLQKLKLDIHQTFPPHCAVYRFCREEFTIVIRQQDGAQLVQVLNDINKYFAKHPVRTVNGKNISFSFSGGLTKHLENEDFNATLARADSLVYKAKSLGRKQIIFA
ncbi:GGDEF domain-containing protein [Lactobacillus gallinarum]|uniref:GGDEF domain-containing protein n=1 Tax=Lactobacillus gallinarum TaxID=52242 RepID=UPI00248D8C5D|nr:diguanylate cyclase [Lactobacillus gallinarum]